MIARKVDALLIAATDKQAMIEPIRRAHEAGIKVLELARTLRDRGVSVIIVSHNMQDVFAVADRIVVMRRGKKVGERMVKETNADEVVGLMVGTLPGA